MAEVKGLGVPQTMVQRKALKQSPSRNRNNPERAEVADPLPVAGFSSICHLVVAGLHGQGQVLVRCMASEIVDSLSSMSGFMLVDGRLLGDLLWRPGEEFKMSMYLWVLASKLSGTAGSRSSSKQPPVLAILQSSHKRENGNSQESPPPSSISSEDGHPGNVCFLKSV